LPSWADLYLSTFALKLVAQLLPETDSEMGSPDGAVDLC